MSDNADIDDLWVLPEWVSPGMSFTKSYGQNNPNTARYHIRGIVDGMLVLATWKRFKQRWYYLVETPLFLTYDPSCIVDIRKTSKGTLDGMLE